MALFDAYVMVDWSAAATPTTGRDSIWIACYRRRGGRLVRGAPVNIATRAAATAYLIDLFERLLKENCRVLAGFDFPFGYPAGTAAALGLKGLPWKAMWRHLEGELEDADDNANNRFALAERLNARISGGGFPFWGHPPRRDASDFLSARKPRGHGPDDPAERRHADRRHARLQPVWKLAYTGSVGSQCLTGIPRVRQIRQHPRLRDAARIWPFETGLGPLAEPPRLLLAEVYPSLVVPDDLPDLPKDAGQVTAMARHLGRLDGADRLAPLFAGDPGLSAAERKTVEREEAWVLGLSGGPVTAASGKATGKATGNATDSFDYEKSGAEITRQSLAIVRRECDFRRFPADLRPVLERIVQACGMTEIVPDLVVRGDVLDAAQQALAGGGAILCDAQMVKEGIRAAALPAGNRVICTLRDRRTPALAQAGGTTRSAAAVDLWGRRLAGGVVAVGNAPTALFHLLERLRGGVAPPALILGFPVGFVGAVESKQALIDEAQAPPFITLRGRRGGSAMASAAVNALAEVLA